MAMDQLNNVLDQAVMGQYSNAHTTLDAGDIGGTANDGIVLSTANVADIFTAQGRTLNSFNRLSPNRFSIIGPRMLEKIQLYVGGRETGFGEEVSDNGKVAKRFGFQLFLSNNLPYTATLTTSATISNGETVVINGVTFTFATTATSAGDVDLGSTDAEATTNLVAAINGTGTPSATTYIDISADERQLLEEAGIAAVDNTTTISLSGYGDIVVSETMAQAANVWSAQTQYSLSGINGAIAMITQAAPNVEFRDAQLRLGKYVHPWTLYGVGVFERMKKNLVATKFDVSDWV